MPFSGGAFTRIWRFIDRYTTNDTVDRADLDTALDDVKAGINGAVTYLLAEIESSTGVRLYLGASSTEPTEDLDGNPLVAGHTYVDDDEIAYIFDGSDWQKIGDLPLASTFFKTLVTLTSAAQFRAALGLGTAATATLSTLATANDLTAEENLTLGTRQLHVTGGTGNAFAITTAASIAAYAPWQMWLVRFNRAPTGTSTLNVDGVGDIDLKVMQETGVLGNVAANDWRAGDTFWILYTAGFMVIVRNANDLAGIPFEEGDIIYHNGTKPTRLAIGTAGQRLAVNSGATALEYVDPPNDLGDGQTWTDVSGSRSSGVDYQNTTGRTIAVSIKIGASGVVEVSDDGSAWVQISGSNNLAYFVVPNTHYYRVTTGTPTIWAELL